MVKDFWFRFSSFINHFKSAHDLHGLHSPFVYDWYEQCVEHEKYFFDFESLESQSDLVFKNKDWIEFEELGAKKKGKSTKQICQIAKASSSSKTVRELLYKTVDKFQPKSILEIGCSLGLSSQYLVKAMPQNGELYLFDGNKQVLEHALQLCRLQSPLKKVVAVHGLFDETLARSLDGISSVDFVYFDGNHTYEATKKYFNMVLPKLSENAILVFDDIYWSEEMKKAWDEIVKHKKITYSIDLFCSGFCFIGINAEKQHFVMKMKPYLGLF
ncbi:MAG: class I SAM-dependent methyltransferase [Cytophagales bacterium]